MMGKDEATVAAAAAIYAALLGAGKRKSGINLSLIPNSVDAAEQLVDELQKRGYVNYDGEDGVAHHFIVPPRSRDQQ